MLLFIAQFPSWTIFRRGCLTARDTAAGGSAPGGDDDPLLDPQYEATAIVEFGTTDAKCQELAVYLDRMRGLNPELP